jgi:hypothetical protein
MALLPPFAGLALASLVVAIAVLAAYKLTSNQPALKQAKRGVAAGLLELRLFQDDPVLVARALRRLLGQQALYLRYALVPLLFLALPLLPLLSSLDAWFSRAPLSPGATSVVVMKAAIGAGSGRPVLLLHAPDGVRVETPVVWSSSTREAAWGIRAERRGAWPLQARAGDVSLTAVVHVGDHVAKLDPDQGANSLTIDYPKRRFDVAGLSFSWIPVFLTLTFLLTLLLRPFFRVSL